MNDSAVPATALERDRIAPVRFAHIVFKTSQKEAMVDWYTTVLEAKPAMQNPLVTFLTFDDEHHRIAIVTAPGLREQDRETACMEHCAFTYANLGDLLSTYERLKAAGITPYWTINHGPTLSCYYRDPDGNQIELQIDIFSSTEAVNEWFASSDFPDNPIGVKFDPDELLVRFRSGESFESLTRRPVIPLESMREQLPA